MAQSLKYQEFEVPERLRRHVRCVWHLQIDDGSGRIETVYPDGCCELIAHCKTPMHVFSAETGWRQQERCVFATQQRSAIQLAAHGEVDTIGVRLQPAASAVLAEISLPDLSVDRGFSDQAHATREVRRVTGTKPARLRAALIQDRHGDSSVRMAAAFIRGRLAWLSLASGKGIHSQSEMHDGSAGKSDKCALQ